MLFYHICGAGTEDKMCKGVVKHKRFEFQFTDRGNLKELHEVRECERCGYEWVAVFTYKEMLSGI